jgi:hypothetical protein
VRVSISGRVVIEVTTPQAVRAMIAVRRSDGIGRNIQTAVTASEGRLAFAMITATLIA